jgi:GTP-binding protein
LIDTGGIEPESEDIILKQMKRQAETAIETADVIVFMVDGKDGVTPADNEVANILRKANKPVLLVVNKVDNISQDALKYEFYNLGMGDPIAVSASESLGIGDLLDEIIKNFKQYENRRRGNSRNQGCINRQTECWEIFTAEPVYR